MILATCPPSKYLGPLRLFYKGRSSPSWIDVKPLGAEGSSGGFFVGLTHLTGSVVELQIVRRGVRQKH